MDGGEEARRESVVSSGDAPEVLEAAEHAFDRVAVAVERGREAWLPAPVRLRRDVGDDARSLDLPADGVAVIAFVAMKHSRVRKIGQQRRGRRAVRDLTSGQQESDRPALAVRERVELGRASAAGAADRLIALPPLPPAAERWAFTAELSIMT